MMAKNGDRTRRANGKAVLATIAGTLLFWSNCGITILSKADNPCRAIGNTLPAKRAALPVDLEIYHY